MAETMYERIGAAYVAARRTDTRIAQAILAAIGDARSVVNVGAGTGSYEPTDREVVAVEPSVEMIRCRPVGGAPVVRATAEALPFRDGSFDSAPAVLTLHHWADWRAGVSELRRVARRAIVLTSDTDVFARYWLNNEYFPEVVELELASGSAGSMPNISKARLRTVSVEVPPLPLQSGFACRVAAVGKLKGAHRASLAELDALFAALQHRAFRGELQG
jgi:SAM-dependent methyltransferase